MERDFKMENEIYIHETIMHLISILQNEGKSLDLSKLTEEFCKISYTKPLMKLSAWVDSAEERIMAFTWQHPAIFCFKDQIVSLRPMSDDIDDQIESTLEDRLVEFLKFRARLYGPYRQIPISKLWLNVKKAASDIRYHFYYDFSRFVNILRSRNDVFTLTDGETVALKSVADKAYAQDRRLLDCYEYAMYYDLDERVLKCTSIVTSYEQSIHIVDEILNTKEIVAIDCEGVNLGAPHGFITLIQLAIFGNLPPNSSDEDIASSIRIYLFDVHQDERLATIALRKLFVANHVIKIFQGCSSDVKALHTQYNILVCSVFDIMIAHRKIRKDGKSNLYYLYELYVGESTNDMKKDIVSKYIAEPQLWTTRPLDEFLTYYAAFDVFAIARIYFKLKVQFDQWTYEDILTRSSSYALSLLKKK